jgi:Mce-associated membrane protein
MSVSLYDLLDVNEDATPGEIRSAWKVAIADLDPTERRFRAYNDAAGVLLDADKRAAYDAELAAERTEAETPAEPAGAAEAAEPAPKMKAEPEPPPDEPEAAVADPVSSGPPTWALFVAAGAAVLSVALLLVVSFWPGSWGGDSPADQVEQAEVAEDAGVSAVDAATSAVPAVLSYDYRTLDADFAEAESYLTEEFADKRAALFEQEAESGMTLREQVVNDEVVVVARVSGTGLTRVSEDGDRATVVVFVDQDSQKGKGAPRSLRMWATLSMIADGDDWLLDDICTEDDCG